MVHKKKKSAVLISSDNELSNEPRALTTEKRARLIVRNLPFAKLSEDLVRNIFADYGSIIDINLLKKEDGKYVGCGFVEYDRRQSAAKAIVHVNGRKISGRNIIVDWALPKNTFVERVQQINASNKVKEEDLDDEEEKPNFNQIVEYSIDNKPEKYMMDNQDDECDDDSEMDDGDVEDEESETDKKPRIASNDVEEGKTVFIKNVPFSATNEDVKKCVEKYGSVIYSLICIDKLTEHSKGSAFVKFKEKESADNCIKNSKNIFLNEQPLEVTRAVSKSKLEEEKKKQKLKTKDSRNLYLVREGVIMAGSPAAATVSAADMTKRLQIEQWKTQILRNLNMFVSKTRLVVHNLPPNCDDNKLRELMIRYSPPNAVVTEARVMQDRKKFDGQGEPLSKEVGFVTFTTHEDALHLLRQINNNPKVFTPARRPIVSFSIENRQIINLKQKRLEKSRAKVMGDRAKLKNLEKLNRKQRRFLKRREKLIKIRQETKKLKKEGVQQEVGKNKMGKEISTKIKKPDLVEADKNLKQNYVHSTPSPSRKRKRLLEESGTLKKKNRVKEEDENFGGVQSVPGKKLKMRSRLKIKKQAEIHRQRLKEIKKVKKVHKNVAEKKQQIRQREPKIKKKKNLLDGDAKFAKLISSYKQKIENASSFKKWYES